MKQNNEMILFYNGPFSQWFPCLFEIDGTMFNCAEQYMMFMKAIFFGDEITASAVLRETDPGEQKKLGRQVKGFNALRWASIAPRIVYDGNMAKFKSDKALRSVLMNTGNLEIVEASPTDTIWGVGLSEDDPEAFDRTKWKGKNLLGKALMNVRQELSGGVD